MPVFNKYTGLRFKRRIRDQLCQQSDLKNVICLSI